MQLASIEGSIGVTEREIREISTQSAIRAGGVDFEVSKKKKRLNAELDSWLDKLQTKQHEYMKVDAE